MWGSRGGAILLIVGIILAVCLAYAAFTVWKANKAPDDEE